MYQFITNLAIGLVAIDHAAEKLQEDKPLQAVGGLILGAVAMGVVARALGTDSE